MKVLIISAHPDDEVIGAGGTIARHVAMGDEVYLLIMTQVYEPDWPEEEIITRKLEALEASKILGIKEVYFGGFPTVKLNVIPVIELSQKIANVIDRIGPKVVYTTPKGDINQDHDVVCQATLVACRPLSNCSVEKVLSYEITSTTRFCYPHGEAYFIPNYYVDISKYIEIKLKAMKSYHTELREFPHPRSIAGLEIFNRERGIAIGTEFAEAFVLIREIVR